MVDDEEFGRWWAEATAASELARQARGGTTPELDVLLAEQAAQLSAKALLHVLGAGPWGHDLVRLGAVVAESVDQPLPPPLDTALIRLSRRYSATRYPDAHPEGSPAEHYSAEDTDQALADLDLVLAEVDEMWQQLRAG
ncbi:MAG: HEPN domain-containing protein [Nocardioides sp.]